MKADLNDSGFMQRMQDQFGMDEKAVEQTIEQLDAGQLTDLADALANGNKKAAQQIVKSADTDEDVNPLFRGQDLDVQQKKKKRRRVSSDYQFGIGDDVHVPKIDDETGEEVVDPKTGKPEYEDGTVYLPNGPTFHDKPTIGVKVEGKPRMVERDKVRKLEESVLGMVGVPNLQRMQQLAGIQQPSDTTVEVEPVTTDQTAVQAVPVQQGTDDAAGQINAAFDSIETALPCLRVGDLKAVRQRIAALQTMLNEGVTREGRARKL